MPKRDAAFTTNQLSDARCLSTALVMIASLTLTRTLTFATFVGDESFQFLFITTTVVRGAAFMTKPVDEFRD